MALAREVSGLKKPVPSPRAESTSRPASSTTVIVIGVPSALALSCAARTALSAISSVMSIMSVLSRLSGLGTDGGRFSTKARMPSRASSVSEQTFWAKVSNSSAPRRSAPSPW